MRAVRLGAMLLAWAACADPPEALPPPVTPIIAPPPEGEVAPPPPPPEDAGPTPEMVTLDATAPEPSAPSTASFEEATAKPEPVGITDDRAQLTDLQLQAPMRGALASCKIPPKAKVTIKTAVQNGRAIGVTVLVDLPAPKPPKKPTEKSKKVAAAHAKTVAKVTACADKAVRALNWPPSRRRDAFTTTF